MDEEKERFLSRWSRLKQAALEKENTPQRAVASGSEREAQPPELPPLEKLSLDSDYRGFFHPKVDENLRRAALKRLFSDPHFNVMDGLDVYIDDYSKPSPMPAEMLATLRQAQSILNRAKELKEEEGQRERAAVRAAEAPALGPADADDAPSATPLGSDRVADSVEPAAPLSREQNA